MTVDNFSENIRLCLTAERIASFICRVYYPLVLRDTGITVLKLEPDRYISQLILTADTGLVSEYTLTDIC